MTLWLLAACRQELHGVEFVPGDLPGTAFVTFRSDRGGVATVTVEGVAGGEPTTTPPSPAETGRVALLGLRPDEPVEAVLTVTDAHGGTSVARVPQGQPPPLPDGTPAFRLARRVPESCVLGGYVLTSTLAHEQSGVQILDDEGRTVWVHPNDEPQTLIWRVRPALDGRSLWWNVVDDARATDRSALRRLALDGTSSERRAAPFAHHDFWERPDGAVDTLTWTFADLDVPSLGVTDPDPLVGDALLEVAADGGLREWWNQLDPADWPFAIDGAVPETARCPTVPDAPDGFVPGRCEVGHGNSLLELPGEDAALVMFRWLDALVKVRRSTGEVEWVFGGPHDGFAGRDADRFVHAHASEAWRDEEGLLHVLVADNHDAPPGEPEADTRFAEYVLDEVARTFERTWVYQSDEFEGLLGDVRRLPGCDHVLISFSGQGRVAELTRDGEVLWDVDLVAGNVTSRVTWLPDLYDLGAGHRNGDRP